MRVSWGHFSPSPQGGTSQVTHCPAPPSLSWLGRFIHKTEGMDEKASNSRSLSFWAPVWL